MPPEVLTFKFEIFRIYTYKNKINNENIGFFLQKKILIKIIFSQYNVDISLEEYDIMHGVKIKYILSINRWISVTHFRKDDALR